MQLKSGKEACNARLGKQGTLTTNWEFWRKKILIYKEGNQLIENLRILNEEKYTLKQTRDNEYCRKWKSRLGKVTLQRSIHQKTALRHWNEEWSASWNTKHEDLRFFAKMHKKWKEKTYEINSTFWNMQKSHENLEKRDDLGNGKVQIARNSGKYWFWHVLHQIPVNILHLNL